MSELPTKIKRLPPGEAFGARDLQTWSQRRLAGRSGSGDKRDNDTMDAAARWLARHDKRPSSKARGTK